MRLTKVLERQTGYLIFIRSNRGGVFSTKYSALFLPNSFPSLFYTSTHFSRLFPGREMPLQNSQLFLDRGNPAIQGL